MRTVLSNEDIAFENGFHSYENGDRITANPYPEGSKERTAWTEGWKRGQECDGTCNE